MIEVGKKAPAFRMSASNGKTISLADFKGKKVVLYFYPKDNTSGCTKEACDFRDHIASVKKQDAVVIGVSPDSLKSHDNFISKFDLPFLLGSDESKEVLHSYGVWKEKSMYGRKYMGVERTTIIIDGAGKVARIFPKVKVNGHVEEVLQALKEIK